MGKSTMSQLSEDVVLFRRDCFHFIGLCEQCFHIEVFTYEGVILHRDFMLMYLLSYLQ